MPKYRKSTLPNGQKVYHRWCDVPDILYAQVLNHFQSGIVLEEGDVIFDIGANIGIFSLMAYKAMGGKGTILAFEPMPTTFSTLERNAESCEGVVSPFCMGMSDKPGIAEFYYYPFASVFSSMESGSRQTHRDVKNLVMDKLDDHDQIPDVYREKMPAWLHRVPAWITRPLVNLGLWTMLRSKRVECRLVTVSDMIRYHQVDDIALIKIDVEHAELAVLQGIEPEHWPYIKQVAVEVHDIDGRLDIILTLLKEKGFTNLVVNQEEELVGSNVYAVVALRKDRDTHEN